jgi:hypothetical protein
MKANELVRQKIDSIRERMIIYFNVIVPILIIKIDVYWLVYAYCKNPQVV